MFDQITEYYSLAKLIDKINHHKPQVFEFTYTALKDEET